MVSSSGGVLAGSIGDFLHVFICIACEQVLLLLTGLSVRLFSLKGFLVFVVMPSPPNSDRES